VAVQDVGEMGGTCSTHVRDEKCIQYLVVKSEGKRPLGRTGRRWKKILQWILGKWSDKLWTGCIWLRTACYEMFHGVSGREKWEISSL